MKVTAVRAKNFMGIREVEIHPGERSLILIAGANEAGKTSVLRILATALYSPAKSKKVPDIVPGPFFYSPPLCGLCRHPIPIPQR